jgi:hypothetical protein
VKDDIEAIFEEYLLPITAIFLIKDECLQPLVESLLGLIKENIP